MTKSIKLIELWHQSNPDPNAVACQVIALDTFNELGLGSLKKAQGGLSLEQQLIDLFEGGALGENNYRASNITRDYMRARDEINKGLEQHGLQIRVY